VSTTLSAHAHAHVGVGGAGVTIGASARVVGFGSGGLWMLRGWMLLLVGVLWVVGVLVSVGFGFGFGFDFEFDVVGWAMAMGWDLGRVSSRLRGGYGGVGVGVRGLVLVLVLVLFFAAFVGGLVLGLGFVLDLGSVFGSSRYRRVRTKSWKAVVGSDGG
jgi:hypothetical protein